MSVGVTDDEKVVEIRMEKHRRAKASISWHHYIDIYGIVMEQYWVIQGPWMLLVI